MMIRDIQGQNNSVPDDLGCEIVCHGDNNVVSCGLKTKLSGKIIVYGNNNHIYLGDNVRANVQISIGRPGREVLSSLIKVGNNSVLNSVRLELWENESRICVGNGCQFATEIDVYASDSHSILDFEGNLLNYGKFVEIGNHVWVCKGVKIGKNVSIPSNSIIGWGSVVTKSFTEEYVVIAGNPAKIVKRNVVWNALSPNNYLLTKKK